MDRQHSVFLQKAIQIARIAHAAKGGKGAPDPMRRSFRIMETLASTDAQIVAVLLGAMGSAEITLDMLQEEGFPEECLEVLQILSPQKGERAEDRIFRIREHPLAREVQLAVLTEEMDLGHKDRISGKDLARNRSLAATRDFLLGKDKISSEE